MGEITADLNVRYTNYTDNDFNPSSVFDGEDTAGMTILCYISGIRRRNSRGELVGCSLAVSFGDPNFGPRIGRRFNFGPEEFEIPEDGVIAAVLTIGYLKNNYFALRNGNTINIPSGLATSTVAAYFDPGNSESNVAAATIYVITPGSVTSGGAGPPLTEAPRDLTLIDPTFDSLGRFNTEFQFTYDNALGETPFEFEIRARDKFEGDKAISYTIPAFVSGQTTYNVPMITPMSAWGASENPLSFYVVAVRANGTTSPTSNVITLSNSLTFPYNLLYPPISPTAPVAQQVTAAGLVGNLSGIYTLTQNQRYDNVYNRAPFIDMDAEGLVTAVKIPNPRFRTAFIP